jgi:hypothetical protein
MLVIPATKEATGRKVVEASFRQKHETLTEK